MKRIVLSLIIFTFAVFAFASVSGVEAEPIAVGEIPVDDFLNKTVTHKNNGYFTISGTKASKTVGVTLEITDDSGKTVFMGAEEADSEGNYEFNIYLSESGKYTLNAGSKDFMGLKTVMLNYVNSTDSSNVCTEIKDAVNKNDITAIEAVLKEDIYDIGVFGEISKGNSSEAAQVLYNYIKDNSDKVSDDNIGNITEKAYAVALFKNGSMDDIGIYNGGFGISGEKIEEFYDSDFSQELTELMSEDNITSIEEYNESMEENVLYCLIKYNDSAELLKKALTEYSGALGINKEKITDNMCRALMSGSGINNVNDAVSFANTYKEPTVGGGPGGSSYGSYTGGGSGSNNYSGTTFAEEYMPHGAEAGEVDVFGDLADVKWAREAINSLYSKGIINGKQASVFAPNDSVLREEFVKMLVLSFELSVTGDPLKFTDVDADLWYYDYVDCAVSSGIAKGYSEQLFGIGDRITRQDIAVMVYNAVKICDYKFKDAKSAAVSFIDESDIADYAREAVTALANAGVINGNENKEFNPNGYATRAEAAKIVYEAMMRTEEV